MLEAYRERRSVARQGDHPVLRWLTIARAYPPAEEGDDEPACPLDAYNAMPLLLTCEQCQTVERKVAARVLDCGKEYPRGYLEYAAAFFLWWYRIAAILTTPELPLATDTSSWLGAEAIERSLVVPDVRRAAIQLSQQLEIRAGEFEVVSAMSGSRTRALSVTLQALRTGDWNVKTHHTIMYGTVLDIYHGGLLSVVQLAVVDSRYLGRIGFAFAKEVIRCPASTCTALGAWPLIFVHGDHYITSWRTGYVLCRSFADAYSTWRDMCLELGGVIGGRYDVRKCTI